MTREQWLATIIDAVHKNTHENEWNFYFHGFPGCRDSAYRVYIARRQNGSFKAFKWASRHCTAQNRWRPCCNTFCETLRTLAFGMADIT